MSYLFVFNFAKSGKPDQNKTTLMKIVLYYLRPKINRYLWLLLYQFINNTFFSSFQVNAQISIYFIFK